MDTAIYGSLKNVYDGKSFFRGHSIDTYSERLEKLHSDYIQREFDRARKITFYLKRKYKDKHQHPKLMPAIKRPRYIGMRYSSNPYSPRLRFKALQNTRKRTRYNPPSPPLTPRLLSASRPRSSRYLVNANKRRRRNRRPRRNKKFKRSSTKEQRIARNGALEKLEYRGTVTATSTGAVYCGHGPACEIILFNVLRAIVKELFHQAGHEILNYDQVVPSPTRYKIYFTYIADPVSAPQTISSLSYQVAAPQTYNQVVDSILTQLRTSITSDRGTEAVQWYMNDPYDAPEELRLATLSAKEFQLDIAYSSTVKIQNQTLADGGTGENDTITDINANPLVGYKYRGLKHWANHFIPIYRSGVAARPFVSHDDFGFIALNSDTTETTILQKPPSAWVIGFKKRQPCAVDPGQIVADKHKWSAKMSLARFWTKVEHLVNSNEHRLRNLGTVSLVGLEKKMDSVGTGGQSIVIGFQLDQTYKVGGILKRGPRTVHEINHNNTPGAF